MRQGQVDALAATAKAVAARLANDPTTLDILNQFNPPAGSVPVYVHRINSAPQLDGYDNEWLEHTLSSQALRGAGGNLHAQISASVITREASAAEAGLSLFLRVNNNHPHYFNPTLRSPLMSDHVILHVTRRGQPSRLVLYASGPGDLQTAWLNADNSLQADYWTKGASREWPRGYQMELQLPLGWAQSGLGIEIFQSTSNANTKDIPNERVATNLGINNEIPPLILFSNELARQLSVFSRPGVKLQIATRGSRVIASAGQLDSDAGDQLHQRHLLLNWFYRVALGAQKAPSLDSSNITGILDTPEVSEALRIQSLHNEQTLYGWYELGEQRLARVTAPIMNTTSPNTTPVAVVVADESADSLATLTSSAFYKLLFYSLAVTLSASLGLIMFASWLSFRIRRLSQAAAGAISENGKIADDFPVFNSRDEIGDLSRNYATLLTRLREYTNYLRSLSSKLSHELRTPLAIVKSSLENLEHENLSEKAQTYADRAKEGTSRLSNILNAMSAASRVEQAISAAEMEDIPCDELLTNLKGAYEDVYQQARFKLNIRRDGNTFSLNGSGELLVQMFDKLVDNAADFCPVGGRIELGLYRDGNHLVFTVHNEGPPLPRHMHGQLFDSMVSVREKSSSPDAGQHLGLGLYIVRLIADFHRGEVHCYNVPDNSGVIFEIRLPAA